MGDKGGERDKSGEGEGEKPELGESCEEFKVFPSTPAEPPETALDTLFSSRLPPPPALPAVVGSLRNGFIERRLEEGRGLLIIELGVVRLCITSFPKFRLWEGRVELGVYEEEEREEVAG